tara:strand:- start:23 stop:301 length:279 start_codon:yes stop_codon:yes gene_type:complete
MIIFHWFVIFLFVNCARGGVYMIKFLLSFIFCFSFSFSQEKVNAVDTYYAQLDKANNTYIAAAKHKKEDKKSPFRKRHHKRKRKIRYPSRGK